MRYNNTSLTISGESDLGENGSMKRCIYCGNENEDSASVCAFCGNPLPDIPDGQEKRYTGFSGNPDDDARRSAQGGQGLFGLDHQDVPADNRGGVLPEAQGQKGPMDSPAFLRGEQAEMPVEQRQMYESYGNASDPARQRVAASGRAYRMEDFSPSSVVTFPSGGGNAGEMDPRTRQNTYGDQGMTPGPQSYLQQDPRSGNGQRGGYREGTRQNADQEQAFRRQEYPSENPGGNPYFHQKEQGYDSAPGYGRNWQQDVGRGQTFAAREQVENPGRNDRMQDPRDQYGNAGYGYRQVQGSPVRERGDYGRSSQNTNGGRAFIVRARKMVRSFLFVLLAFFFSLMVVSNIYNILSGNALYNLSQADTMLAGILGGGENSFMIQMISEFAKQLVSMIVNVNAIVKQLGGTVKLLILLVFLIPNILLAIGFWLMFAQTTTRRKQFPMGGYMLARVMMVLKFIVACLVLVIGLVISVYFVVVGASSSQFTSSLIEGIFMLVAMIIASVLTVMFYLQWMFSLKVVALNARNGQTPGRVPMFVCVISLLGAVVSVLLMIPMSPDDYFGLLARGSAAGSFLFSGIWLLVYRIRVRKTA